MKQKVQNSFHLIRQKRPEVFSLEKKSMRQAEYTADVYKNYKVE